MANQVKSLAIVGGGASGLAAAVMAGMRARERGAHLEITIFESDERMGRSILATGNGRCNFSNSHLDVNAYHNSAFVADALNALSRATRTSVSRNAPENGGVAHACSTPPSRDAVLSFFERIGLAWREEPDGRMYPSANKASVVLDVLRAAAARMNVRESCETEIARIVAPQADGKRFTLHRTDGVIERADTVIVACGGRFLNSLDLEEIQLLPQRPVLGPLRVVQDDVPFVRELDNIRVRCAVALERDEDGESRTIAHETGELMFRKYGVSGICVFNLSRFAQAGDTLSINLMGDKSAAQTADLLEMRDLAFLKTYDDQPSYDDVLRGLLLPRVSEALLKRTGIKGSRAFTVLDAPALARLLTACTLTVTGIGDESICQVRRGGVPVSAVDSNTMQVHDVPGLYIVGEALDVDGPCGGYNLHWAWASGMLAAHSAIAT